MMADADQVSMLLGQVMLLGNMVNNATEYAIRVDLAGHVKTLQVEIAESKKAASDWVSKAWIPLDDHNVHAPTMLQNVITNLKYILATGELPELPPLKWGRSVYLDLGAKAKASDQLGGTTETLR